MKYKLLAATIAFFSTPLFAADNAALQEEILRLQKQTQAMQARLDSLQKKLCTKKIKITQKKVRIKPTPPVAQPPLRNTPAVIPDKDAAISNNSGNNSGSIIPWHSSLVHVHVHDETEKVPGWYPVALMADSSVIAWVASTPVVLSPYTGDRPAFDGSDYLVNISSINRDVRLMEQRKRLYDAYTSLGYPAPDRPILAISGKLEPFVSTSRTYRNDFDDDLTLGSAELDIGALINADVEAFISIAYDESPPIDGGPRVTNSSFDLNLGFVNIGNLDKSPIYFTAGQLFAPYGRYSSAMISAPLTMRLARNKTRPAILGYKTQQGPGPFAQLFGFKTDTTLGKSGNGGISAGFTYDTGFFAGEIGGSIVRSIADADGMQLTFFGNEDNFGGFGSPLRGNEAVKKIPGADIYGILRFDRYNLTAEWVGATNTFRTEDLSFNGAGARPQAAQLEAGATFMIFDRPASVGVGYQWTTEALALGLPKHRYSGVFNISIWKDTLESIEFRHDVDYGAFQYANGASPEGRVNVPILGTGGSSNTLLAQLGVFF